MGYSKKAPPIRNNTAVCAVYPNDGDLVDAFGDWVTDEAMRRRIMVDNPAGFYRF
jgi:predicted TIM-barrel fold metal-dependent hydrolase